MRKRMLQQEKYSCNHEPQCLAHNIVILIGIHVYVSCDCSFLDLARGLKYTIRQGTKAFC